MMRPSRAASVLALAACLALQAARGGETDPAAGPVENDMRSAGQMFDTLFDTGLSDAQRARIRNVLRDAQGFVVLPNVLKLGIGVSAIEGRGVLVYRNPKGVWQPPLPLRVTGNGFGPHFGLIAFDTLVPLLKPVDLETVFRQEIHLTGRDSLGPLRASGDGGIVAYTRGRGLSAGLSEDSIRISLDQQAIAALYGIRVEARELFSGKLDSCRKPLPAQKLLEKANEFATGAPITSVWTRP